LKWVKYVGYSHLRQLGYVTAARFSCLVFAVLCFGLASIVYISIVMILQEVCCCLLNYVLEQHTHTHPSCVAVCIYIATHDRDFPMRSFTVNPTNFGLYHNFPHYFKNGGILEIIIQNEMCLDGVYTFCVKHCQTLLELEYCRQIFEKYPNTKFHENPFSWSRSIASERTDKQKDYTQTGRQSEANGHLSKLCKHAYYLVFVITLICRISSN
jgi:hypothetical protein